MIHRIPAFPINFKEAIKCRAHFAWPSVATYVWRQIFTTSNQFAESHEMGSMQKERFP